MVPAKGQASPVSLETSHDKNTPDRIVSKGGGGRPAAWLYPVRVRTVLAAGAVSASRAVSVQHPPPFLTPAPPRAACPRCQTGAPFVRLRGAPAELAADATRYCARTLNAMLAFCVLYLRSGCKVLDNAGSVRHDGAPLAGGRDGEVLVAAKPPLAVRTQQQGRDVRQGR